MISNNIERLAPPETYFEGLAIPELIIATRRAMQVANRKTFLADVLATLLDELDDYEIERFKEQMDRADGYAALILRKRLHYKLWPTDTGPVSNDRRPGSK